MKNSKIWRGPKCIITAHKKKILKSYTSISWWVVLHQTNHWKKTMLIENISAFSEKLGTRRPACGSIKNEKEPIATGQSIWATTSNHSLIHSILLLLSTAPTLSTPSPLRSHLPSIITHDILYVELLFRHLNYMMF